MPAYLAGGGWPDCRSARAFHGAQAPATRSPRHQNGCEAEPGTCWGMLRANHFVNSHEQGVRTMVARAEPTMNSWRQDRRPEQGGGGQKVAALVVGPEAGHIVGTRPRNESQSRRSWAYARRGEGVDSRWADAGRGPGIMDLPTPESRLRAVRPRDGLTLRRLVGRTSVRT